MQKQLALRPLDMAVAIALAVLPPERRTFAEVGHALGLSASTVHQSVSRLSKAGLLLSGEKAPNVTALRSFLVHGARHAFPPMLGKESRGVPTAHAGPLLREEFDGDQPLVWPDIDGAVRGTALTPLYPQATTLPRRAPRIYAALTLVDAIRAGQSRERNLAVHLLEQALQPGEGAGA